MKLTMTREQEMYQANSPFPSRWCQSGTHCRIICAGSLMSDIKRVQTLLWADTSRKLILLHFYSTRFDLNVNILKNSYVD